MTAARLSPAATLLRNSRLFALPPPIPLPAAQPSSEPVARSETATTPWPVRAAIETPVLSQTKGDWGLKRPLPLKSTTKSSTPVIRIQRGIDTSEHIADFESAADHVLTLQKWQKLNVPITLPAPLAKTNDERGARSVFNSSNDNAHSVPTFAPSKSSYTGIWPDIDPAKFKANLPPALLRQEKKSQQPQAVNEKENPELSPEVSPKLPAAQKSQYRWRYDGPWLAGMTGMEFDAYLEHVVRGRREEFRERVKAHIVAEKKTMRKEEALAEGRRGSVTPSEDAQQDVITEEDVKKYIKALRSRPGLFGSLITEFLDLPEGPRDSRAAAWENGRITGASSLYKDFGPPKSHPSAGLSYFRTRTFSDNDPVFGPQELHGPVVARVLKTRRFAGGSSSDRVTPTIGVAGFVSLPLSSGGIASNSRDNPDPAFREFRPQKGGRKMVVVPQRASLNPEGSVDLSIAETSNFLLNNDNQPVRLDLFSGPLAAHETRGGRMEPLDTPSSRTRSSARPAKSSYRSFTQTVRDKERMRPARPEARLDAGTLDLVESMEEHFAPQKPS